MSIGPKQKTSDLASKKLNSASETGVLDLVLTAAAASAVVAADSAVTDILTATFPASVGADGNTVSILLTTNTSDALSVTETAEVITIALADTTAANNTAALIQAAIRALTATDAGVSLVGITCVAGGNWDIAAIATGEVAAVNFTGGVDSAETILTTSQQLNNVIIVTNANADENIVATPTPGKDFVIQNDTLHTITVKAAGETGVTVATTEKVYVYCDGTDFAKLT